MRNILLIITAVLSLMPAYAADVAKTTPPGKPLYDPVIVGKPPFRRLFLDAMVVEESNGLERFFHSVEKYPANPVLPKEKDWEDWGPSIGGSVIKVGDLYRMYYYCIETACCVAESRDGIKWTRPIVGDIDYKGSKRNNLIPDAGQVFEIAKPASPDRRFIMYNLGGRMGPHLDYSADGLHWKRDNATVGLFTTSDVANFFYDPYADRYGATWKVGSRRHRSVGVALSTDGLTWTKPVPGPVFCPDDLDPDATQIYGMPVFPYQGVYIGLPWVFHARWIKYGRYESADTMVEAQKGSPCNIDVQLAWSWDLINWTRTPKREPFIPNGPDGAFDDGMIITAAWPVLVDDTLFFYYGAFDQVHDDYEGIHDSIGLATLRLDGFCSMRAGDEEGWLISRREVFNTPKVTINAKCGRGGYVAAELVNRDGEVVPGFSRDDCVPFTGDSVRGELTWKIKEYPRYLINNDMRIRFYIKNADLYSYLPADINQKIDDGHPDH